MLLRIPQILTEEEVRGCREGLAKADWTDGRATAGHQAMRVKRNTQARYDDPTVQQLGKMILAKIQRHPVFVAASLPFKVVPPLFNRYAEGEYYGPHIDGAIRPVEGTAYRVRTDLSATIFLSAPEDYDGGELVIEDTFGGRRIKLPAGDMILYSGTSIHHVEPVTRGARLASFFWIQSMVRDDGDRTMLFNLDNAIQDLQRNVPGQPAIVQLTNLYHNLLRRWADA